MFSREKFASRLVTTRRSANIPAMELAENCGISQASISTLEHAKNSPSVETLCLIADYLNVSVDYLIGNEEKKITTDADLCDKIALLPKAQQDTVKEFVDFLLARFPASL